MLKTNLYKVNESEAQNEALFQTKNCEQQA